jgi:hypothetical protein
MQQVIQIILAKERKNLDIYSVGTNEQQNSAHTQQNTSASCTTTNTSTSTPANHRTNTQPPINQTNRRCHAIKCRLLRAKGILPRPMLCASTKHMCSGCLSEPIRHKKTAQIEMDILSNMAPNTTWAPLLEYLDKLISLHHLRRLLGHLPTFGNTRRRDDHIFGATRYIANTLGFKLETRCISENIDQPPSDIEQKRLWHMAKFQCRCQRETRSIHPFAVRNFCQVCHFSVYYTEQSDQSICPVCMQHEAWQQYGSPCLACQCAAIVYRNPFQDCLQKQMELWLHQNDSEEDTGSTSATHTPNYTPSPTFQQNYTDEELLLQRNKAFQHSFQEIRSRAPPNQSRHILENLSILHHTIRQNVGTSKHSCSSQDHDRYTSSVSNGPSINSAHHKKSRVARTLFSADTETQTPLRPIDMNRETDAHSSEISAHPPKRGDRRTVKHNRTLAKKQKAAQW